MRSREHHLHLDLAPVVRLVTFRLQKRRDKPLLPNLEAQTPLVLSFELEKSYSYLNATMGSTFAARRAGIAEASNDTATIMTTAAAIEAGSVGVTP